MIQLWHTEIEHMRNEIYYLRAESKGLVPVKQELKVEPGESHYDRGWLCAWCVAWHVITHWPLIGYQDVISRPHLPTEVLSQPQESIHNFGKHSQNLNTQIYIFHSLYHST